jgi:hypothetical protein
MGAITRSRIICQICTNSQKPAAMAMTLKSERNENSRRIVCRGGSPRGRSRFIIAVFAQEQDWLSQFHRTDRCDLSLFQIGIRALHYARREGLRIPVSFLLPANPSPRLCEPTTLSAR